MKVFLIRPPSGVFGSLEETGGNREPTNILYLATVLKENNYDVKILDLEVEKISIEEFKEIVKNEKPDVIGITSMTPTINNAMKLASLIKEINKNIIVIFGGAHSTMFPERTLRECNAVDFIVLGEGELTLLELLKNLKNKNLLKKIKGIAYRDKDKNIINSRREYLDNLDELPIPDRDLLKRELYIKPLSPGIYQDKNIKATVILTSRGCPYQCIFCCARYISGLKFRTRSIENVMKEIDEIVKKYNYNYLFVGDDNFTINKNRVLEFCEGIKKYHLKWFCEARVDAVDKELLQKMKEAGCSKIAFGLESGSPKILKLIKKGINPEQVRNAFKWAKEVGVLTQVSIMVGHPTETIEDFNMTMSLVKEIEPDVLFVSISTPYPGTQLYELQKEMVDLSNWDTFAFYNQKPSWRTENFSNEELVELQKKAVKMFYMRPKYILKRLTKIRSFDELAYYTKSGLAVLKFYKGKKKTS